MPFTEWFWSHFLVGTRLKRARLKRLKEVSGNALFWKDRVRMIIQSFLSKFLYYIARCHKMCKWIGIKHCTGQNRTGILGKRYRITTLKVYCIPQIWFRERMSKFWWNFESLTWFLFAFTSFGVFFILLLVNNQHTYLNTIYYQSYAWVYIRTDFASQKLKCVQYSVVKLSKH